MSWWVTFSDGSQACLDTPRGYDQSRQGDVRRADMLALAAEIKGIEATEIATLPYPARPRLNAQVYDDGSSCPSFCFTPKECAGRTSCPRRRACDD